MNYSSSGKLITNIGQMLRMKYLYLLLGIAILTAGCTSSEKLLEKGKYDKAIEKSAKALRKDAGDADELYVLKEAYKQANLFDRGQIDFLEKENRDENWLEIYFLYRQLENRQNIVRTLPASVRNQFTLIDYDEEIIESKESAAETMYQQGLDYLDRGDRRSARLAYHEFLGIRNIYQEYKDVNQLINEAQYLGTNFVLVETENNSEIALPRNFERELKKISLGDLNSQWVQYETFPDSSTYYDYHLVLNIKQIEISPEAIEKETYTERKEIQDGMRYIFDSNGNVKKDSLGNDIRVPNMVTISAKVTESVQHKEAVVSGSIDYIDLAKKQLIKTEQLSVSTLFEHFSAVVSGDRRALSNETKQRVSSQPVAFPSNEMMLMDAVYLLKDRAKEIIKGNRRLMESSH